MAKIFIDTIITKEEEMKKKILVIHTGGTISMTEDSETGTVTPGDRNPLTESTNQLLNLADLTVVEPFHLPSPHITPKEMLQLKNIIEEKMEELRLSGVVITHGTDTLEETAYFLDLTVNTSLPIVVTGAMRSSNEVGADGLYNLISSIRVAIDDDSKNKGVLVVMNDEIHTARNVTKTHTSNISTFQSPQYGPIGIITKRGIFYHHTPTTREYYDINDISKQVVLVKSHAGMDSALLAAINQLEYEGVVIEALGQGNLPPAAIPGIKALIAKGIPIVLVSRCFNGFVQDTYAYEGGGKELKDYGVIFSNGLNGQKARLKLLITLAKTNNLTELEKMFQA